MLAIIADKDGERVLNVGFMSDFAYPDSIELCWETIPTDGLLRVTLHDVDFACDEGNDAYIPEGIGEPVMTLYDALSSFKAEERDRDALIREAEEEAASATV